MGFACIRGPASGAKAKLFVQPDVVAIRNGYVLVIEVKTRKKGGAVYVEKEQVEKLREWSRRAGPKSLPLIAVYVNKDLGWRFVPLDRTTPTKKGNIRIDLRVLSACPDLLALKILTEPVVRKLDTFIDPDNH